jgi:hypothetical protein
MDYEENRLVMGAVSEQTHLRMKRRKRIQLMGES